MTEEEKYEDINVGKAMLYVADKSYQRGYKEAIRTVKEIIESRIDEIMGDAQPSPILRIELRELLNKIKENDNDIKTRGL